MKFSVSALPCAVVLLMAGGCATGPNFLRTSQPLPADWKNAGGFPVASPQRDLSRWWNRFNDPVLVKVINTALRNSPDMAAAAARVREAQANRRATASSLFPSLTGSTSADTSTSRSNGVRRDVDTSYSLGLSASWEPDLFGKNRAAVAAASAQVNASEENFHSVQASLASEVAIAYTNLRASEVALDVLKRTISSRDETFQLADWRNQAGEADRLEYDQALSSVQQAKASIPGLEQTIGQARNQLSLLAGQNPGALDGLLSSRSHVVPVPERNLAVGIPSDTIRQRPDVRLAGYQLLAAAANTRAAEAEKFPSLSLRGSLGLNTLSSHKLFNPESQSASLVAGLTSPIFDAGRIHANIDASNAAEEQTFQTYRSTVLTALSEVEDALIACRRTDERLAALESTVTTAREAAQLANQRYKAGETDILTVLDAQRSLLGLEDSLASVRASRTIAFIQLYKALGGGW